ncbi:MAG: hypothetical protein AAGA75_23175 [Cyanobacteria bacterium P01_E01_bin.6]
MTKQFKPVELFLSLGLAATLGACGSPAVDDTEGGEALDDDPTTEITPDDTEDDEGGEGGEGGEDG